MNRPAGPAGPEGKRWGELLAPAPLAALAWSAFQIAIFLWPTIPTLVQRAGHVSFAVALALLLTHGKLKTPAMRGLNYLLALLAALPAVYIANSVERIMNERISGLDPLAAGDYAFGILMLLLLAEASRRVLGLGISLLALLFVAYHFGGPYIPGAMGHRFGGLDQFVDTQFLTLQGLYGVPTGVSAQVVFYFILFAAVYDVFGGGRMIIDLAMGLTGRRVGGPAKAAVIASGMMGSVSGSAVANVMSTGIFTIPLMKRVGYDPKFAAGVEAVASTGGQLMPPVMGAAAFVMADMLQIPYSRIVIAAILPSVLYYAALLITVHLQARRSGLLGSIDASELPRLGATLRERGHMLIPLAWLAYQVVTGYPVDQASVQSAVLAVVCGTARKATRAPLVHLANALAAAAERTINVALPCAVAGIIVAVIAYSGLGTKFTSLMVAISGGWLPAMLVLASLGALILGCGMPTTSAYIMAAVLVAPALILLGLDPLVAHFFIFYFAILSMVTPPVALASYAAAAIAQAPAGPTGWKAFVMAMPGFIIPFAVVMHPGLLVTGLADAADAVWGFFNVFTAFVALGAAITGYLFRNLGKGWRTYFAVVGVANVLPGVFVSAVTFAALAVPGYLMWRGERRRPVQTPSILR
ncbi:MAG: TRAP transporter fused permease subunit [Betaproteobacteria bacterium]|nr:TRAP transporter fused permease subunit [Betaproteobacteria bacterium]